MLIKFTILLLQININIATTIKNKIKIIFQFYFSSLSTILINNLNEFSYLIFIKDNEIILKYEVIRAMHKTTSNKTLKINKIINYALRQLICIVLS
jgi:hypothetical protein